MHPLHYGYVINQRRDRVLHYRGLVVLLLQYSKLSDRQRALASLKETEGYKEDLHFTTRLCERWLTTEINQLA